MVIPFVKVLQFDILGNSEEILVKFRIISGEILVTSGEIPVKFR